MTAASERRFAGVDGLDEVVSAALCGSPRWEVRGEDVVLTAALAPGLRLEVVPVDEQRVHARVEGVLTHDTLADWLARLRLPRPGGEGSPRPASPRAARPSPLVASPR